MARVKTGNKWAGLEDIYGALTDLWDEAELEGAEQGLGYLTSQDRRTWAKAYTKLETASERNKVRSSMFFTFLFLLFFTFLWFDRCFNHSADQ